MNPTELSAVMPLVSVSLFMLLMLLFGLFSVEKRGSDALVLFLNLGACALGFAFSWQLFVMPEGVTAFGGTIFADAYTGVWNTILLAGTFLTFLLSHGQLRKQGIEHGIDTHALVLLTLLGGMVMVAAADLMVMFLGLELLSVSVYVLAGVSRSEKTSSEGALKYLILGAFSSAFLLYGLALVYGACGTLSIQELAALNSAPSPLLLSGIGLLVFGFGFKVSLVPFHFWTPDVYQGAPTSITAFMATVVKAAAFGAFLRVMLVAFPELSASWEGLLWLLAVLTMTIGNIIALRQESVKRMLAYSSIAHAGYALMGFLVVGASGGIESVMFYLFVYSLMTIVAFGVVLLATSGRADAQFGQDNYQSLSGLGWTHPFLGLCMTIAMLSLGGLPPFAGFIGKFYVFSAAVKANFVGLAIIGALNSVVSLYYYLRVVVVMYFSERSVDWQPEPLGRFAAPRLALMLATAGVIYFGLFSGTYYEIAAIAASSVN